MMDVVALEQISKAIIGDIHAKELSIHSEAELREIIKSFELLQMIPHTLIKNIVWLLT